MKAFYLPKILLPICFFLSYLTQAQPPEAITYQAVARDTGGSLISNQLISLRFSIHDVTATGAVLYSETQSVSTNEFGFFSVNIGQGTVVSGTFGSIAWSAGDKFTQVELDVNGGSNFSDMGVTQMLSVPYALFAGKSNIADGTVSGQTLFWNGTEWVADTTFSNDGGNAGIGTTTAANKLAVKGNQSIGSNYINLPAPPNGLIVEGQAGIGTANPDPSAILDLTSSSQGLLIPRMSTAQRLAIANPAAGLMVFDSTENNFYYYTADISFGPWIPILNLYFGGSGNTLDEAYDEGGAGMGRIITADAGAVEMNANGTNKALVITNSAETGIDVEITGGANGIDVRTQAGDGLHSAVSGTGSGLYTIGLADDAKDLVYSQVNGNANSGSWFSSFGRAGNFLIEGTLSNRPSLQAQTKGPGYGVMGISGPFTSTVEIIPLAGVAGITDQLDGRNGVSGFSRHGRGVWGKTLKTNNWLNDPSTYQPGLFGTATVADGATGGGTEFFQGGVGFVESGAGLIGINKGYGHGVIGVTKSLGAGGSEAGIWGAVMESNWSAHSTAFPFVDGTSGKGPLGVLAQSRATIALWSESQEKIGLVTTTGLKKGLSDLTIAKAALVALSTQPDATTVFIANQGSPAFPALRITSSTVKGPTVDGAYVLDLFNSGTGGGANFITSDLTSSMSTVNAMNMGDGSAGRYHKSNPTSTATTLFSTTAGLGKAGVFIVENPGSPSEVLSAITYGDGSAGGFVSLKATNPSPAFFSNTMGTGPAGKFMVTNAMAVTSAIDVETSGGKIANFISTLPSSTEDAVTITNNGTGNSLKIENAHAAPGAPLGASATALTVESSLGPVAHFDSKYPGFSSPGPVPPATSPVVLISSSSMLQTALKITTTSFGLSNAKAAELDGDVDLTGKLIVGGSINLGSGAGSTSITPTGITAGSVTTGTIVPDGPIATVAGNLHVAGTLTAGVKSFLIDHPLYPDSKYLKHASIESDEMINIYSGNVKTDQNGFAKIELPDWMNALNKDFRYQLTIVGQSFAQAIVWEEINKDGTFVIRTSEPSVNVSWQVTGLRHDKFAEENPLRVESDKTYSQE